MTHSDPILDADDSGVFIEHARWLLEWHNRRSEAMVARATTVLGFNGVMLALLLQGASLKATAPTAWTWTLLISALFALLGSAITALSAIALSTVRMPPAQQLREQWLTHRNTANTGQASRNIAEAFLNSTNIEGPSAVSDALEEANRRATRFTVSLLSMLLGLVLVSALVLNVLSHSKGS